MRTLLDIDFLADEALRRRLAALSLALLAAGARFCAVLLGPAALLSALLLALPCVLGYPLMGAIACVFHLSSCAGDVLAAALALREPSCTHVQDTEAGVRLLVAERG